MNLFADWTDDERKELASGTIINKRHDKVKIFNTQSLPASVNWTAEGAVTPVKDMSKDSCKYVGWAFAVTGALEAAYFNSTGNLTSLSE